jgi:hypothetical protein
MRMIASSGDVARAGLAIRASVILVFLLFNNACSLEIGTQIVRQGKDVDETNTGVPSGRALGDVNSTIIVTEAWIRDSNGGSRIMRDKYFHSGAALIITVDGFTVQYCKFFGKGGISPDPNDGSGRLGKSISILDCELDGNHENMGGDVAVNGSSLTLKRVHIRRWPRSMWIGGNDVLVEGCYMHDLTCDGSDAHIENIYVAGGDNLAFIGNKLISNRTYIEDGTGQISASLAIYNESYASFPNLDHLRVEDNCFESDGGYALYGGACMGKLAPYAKDMTVSGNVFGRGEQRCCGIFGTATAFDCYAASNVWKGNTWGKRGPYWQKGDPEEGDTVQAPPPS